MNPRLAKAAAAACCLLSAAAAQASDYRATMGGLGPIRIFPMKYLAALAMGEGGDRRNRYEKPAYQQEELFLKAAKGLALCGDAGLDRAALAELLRRDPGLVRRSAKE